jgi:ABC-2 type transport system ATP-binding protein
MLDISNIHKSFQDKEVLHDVSFSVSSGEIFSLIGPNGSGKTTLTKILSGLLQPTSGTAVIGGADILQESQKAKAATGYIPDNPSAWSEMTGREFLEFTGVLYGIPADTRKGKVQELLPLFGLSDIADSLFANYSRGNRQKFSILSAFMHEPELILVDEPIVGLDQESVDIMKQLFTDFVADGGAVLITTHTLPIAEDIADRFGVLKSGSVLGTGKLEELREVSNVDTDDLVGVYEAMLAKNTDDNA